MGRDSANFWDNGTEVPSLSRDKGTTGQAQNLAKGRDRPGQPVKIRDGKWDGTVPDFDSLSFPVLEDKMGQRSLSRDFYSCPCPGTKGHRDKKISLSRTVETLP